MTQVPILRDSPCKQSQIVVNVIVNGKHLTDFIKHFNIEFGEFREKTFRCLISYLNENSMSNSKCLEDKLYTANFILWFIEALSSDVFLVSLI